MFNSNQINSRENLETDYNNNNNDGNCLFFMKETKNTKKIFDKLKSDFSFSFNSDIKDKNKGNDDEENNNNINIEKDSTKNQYEVINSKADELTYWLLNDYVNSIKK